MVYVHRRQCPPSSPLLAEGFNLTYGNVLQKLVSPKEGDNGLIDPLAAFPVGPDCRTSSMALYISAQGLWAYSSSRGILS